MTIGIGTSPSLSFPAQPHPNMPVACSQAACPRGSWETDTLMGYHGGTTQEKRGGGGGRQLLFHVCLMSLEYKYV